MRRFLLCSVFLLMAVLPALSGEKHASVLRDDETFTMQSLEKGVLTVTRSVVVYSKKGLDAAVFVEYTSKNDVLSSFSGFMKLPSGQLVKIGKKDLTTVSIASGIAEDGFMTAYMPSPPSYPVTVTYEYTIQQKGGFVVFPVYCPITTGNTDLREGRFTLSVPPGTVIRSHEVGPAGKKTVEKGAKSDTYSWSFSAFDGYVEESYMPSVFGLVPVIYSSPDEFVFDGFPGRQDSWKDIAEWQQDLLKSDPGLPDRAKEKVRTLTEDIPDDLGKIRALYKYLREKTRYVSIQLGIGGFKPFPASTVDRTGFGDCKALSNYMRLMLSEVGIESWYTALSTRSEDFMPGYPSMGQTDHVILTVPLKETKDTLFIECTNPSVPLGYRHEDIAGHELLLIRPEGGETIRARSYPDTIARTVTVTSVKLSEDGSAHLEVSQKNSGRNVEPWIGYDALSKEAKRSLITMGLNAQPQNLAPARIRDNYDSYDGRDWYPECEIGFSFDILTYGQWNGSRMMLTGNPFSKRMEAQRSERVNPLVIKSGTAIVDEVFIDIPDGLEVESMPASVAMDVQWGFFSSESSFSGNRITIRQEVILKPCTLPAGEYGQFRDFVRSMNRSYSSHIVLRKAE